MTLRSYLKESRGRTTLLAEALGVSIALVSYWANGLRRIPAERCKQLSKITGVPLESLRRDLFGRKS